MQVKVKKLNPEAKLPSRQNEGDCGFDLTAIGKYWDDEKDCYRYSTGLAFEIPEGYVGLIFPRSSICKTDLTLSNAVGVIDSGYRGEVCFYFKEAVTNRLYSVKSYNVGDRVGQIIIMPYPKIEFEEVKELSDSARGMGGFGSSGN